MDIKMNKYRVKARVDLELDVVNINGEAAVRQAAEMLPQRLNLLKLDLGSRRIPVRFESRVGKDAELLEKDVFPVLSSSYDYIKEEQERMRIAAEEQERWDEEDRQRQAKEKLPKLAVFGSRR